ncbi:MAG: hypothetical protein A2W19_13320 [Spirochaetes bacterium RBG_16_49_21]|nr:MAG: hypothetical protein A2W19_13320 [Spirochaetes bacterium RBG_16_49_21]
MKKLKKDSRILFTTVPLSEVITENGPNGKYINHNDLSQNMSHAVPRPLQLRSFVPPGGLRFIKENVPNVDTLEYPTWEEFEKKLDEGYDAVGISFLTYTVPIAVKMAKLAKERGIQEVWAGNYGAMTPGIDKYFDRVIVGLAENKIRKILGLEPLKKIKHPEIVLVNTINALQSIMNRKIGILFSTRGCPQKCSFCPTPSFAPDLDYISMDEIEKVLDIYKANKVTQIHVCDETFLLNRTYSKRVLDAMVKRGLSWQCMTRADLIKGKIRELKDTGMVWVGIGLETLKDITLKKQNKGQDLKTLLDVLDEAEKNDLPIWGSFMLCFEDDTVESLKKDIDRLAMMNIFSLQFAIFTPFPGTPLWDKMKNKIIEKDWSKYDHMHLIWDHPKITQKEAEEIFYYAHKKVNRSINYIKHLIKMEVAKKFR